MGSAFPGPLFAVSVGRLAKRLLMALLYVPKTVPLDLTSIVQLSPFLASAKRNHRVISFKASKDYRKPRCAKAGPRLCKARSYSRALFASVLGVDGDVGAASIFCPSV